MQKVSEGALLATVTRNDLVESVHRGAVVVVENGKVVRSAGDPELPVFTRSCIKPFQALPLFERSLIDKLALTEPELCVLIASHDGTEEHVKVVRGLLAKVGLTEEALGCGPHAPYDLKSSIEIAKSGGQPQRIHNNCSGKHAGFLRLAQELDVPLERYLDPECAAQREVRTAVASMLELDERTLKQGTDGCGAPTFHVPLVSLALAFQKLTTPSGLSTTRAHAFRRMLGAITNWPHIFSGRERFCRALIAAAPGRLFTKNGAEGVYCFGVVGKNLGVALKVQDGADRAYFPVVIQVLRELGVLSTLTPELESYARVPLLNTQKRVVGHVQSALEWS